MTERACRIGCRQPSPKRERGVRRRLQTARQTLTNALGSEGGRRRYASAHVWVLLGLLVFLTGCPQPPAAVRPKNAEEALARVNGNVSGIESVLYCPAFVSFKFRDADGKRQSVPVSDARLYFQRPRRLLFEVKSLTGTIAALGSNHDRYWFWAEETLWWGSWARITDPATRRLPVPPDELHDALGLRPLPERLGNGLKPLLRLDGDDHRLLFVRLDEEGEAAGWREVRLQPHEPYLPLEITDRLADGRVLMQATLGNYKRVGKDGPSTPRKYIVEWPLDEAELRLDITRARFRPELEDYPFDKFPSDWTGTVVQIDAPDPPPGLSPADPGGMKR